jgi:hypothetical protein
MVDEGIAFWALREAAPGTKPVDQAKPPDATGPVKVVQNYVPKG